MSAIRILPAFTGALLLGHATLGHAEERLDGFEARTFVGAAGTRLPYRFYLPENPGRDQRLPLIVYLHGSGGAGTDNRRQLRGGNTSGTHVWTTPASQSRQAAFVLAPQIPSGQDWHAPGAGVSVHAQLLIDLLATLVRELAIDADRIYLVGQSLGGFGVWDLVTKRPELFAAGVPLCGGGDSDRAAAARRVAIWAFHGEADRTVPAARSRQMVVALRAAGGSVEYTEYPGKGHDVWTLAFAEPRLPTWLFAQRRSRP